MEMTLREMLDSDWAKVQAIYQKGIDTHIATFRTEAPSFEAWVSSHLQCGKFVAVNTNNEVVGWCALSPTASTCAYQGVAEVSIYVDPEYKSQGIGTALLERLIQDSEGNGIWTLSSSIIEANKISIALHEKLGFSHVGIRKKIAKNHLGQWKNTVLMERRSCLEQYK